MTVFVKIRKYFKLKVQVEHPADVESAIWILLVVGLLVSILSHLI